MKKFKMSILGVAVILLLPILVSSQSGEPSVVKVFPGYYIDVISGQEKDYSVEVTCNQTTTVILTANCPQGLSCSLDQTVFNFNAGDPAKYTTLTVDTHPYGSYYFEIDSAGCTDPSDSNSAAFIDVDEPVVSGCAPGIFYDPSSGFSSSPIAASGDNLTVNTDSMFYAFVDYKKQDSGIAYPNIGWEPDILAPNSSGQYSCDFDGYTGEFDTVGRYKCCTQNSSACSNPIPSNVGDLSFTTFAKYQVPGGVVCERTDTLGIVTVEGKRIVDVEPENSSIPKGETKIFDVTTILEGRSGTVTLAITCPSDLSCFLDQTSHTFDSSPADDIWSSNKLRVVTTGATAGNTYDITVRSTGHPLDGPLSEDTVNLHVTPAGVNSINLIKSGQGTVTSNPSGINCGPSCNSQRADFQEINITLTAEASPGRIFAGWGGDCSGASPTCSLFMDATKNVYAYFAIGLNYKEF